jgi:hypothetical protein
LFDQAAAVRRQAIPDDKEPRADMAHKMAEKRLILR